MQRGSSRLSAHRDEEMKQELQGLIRSGHPTRVEEWHDPEPAADDDPEVTTGPVPSPGATGRAEALRFEFARQPRDEVLIGLAVALLPIREGRRHMAEGR